MAEQFYQTLLSVMEQKVREHDRIFIDTCSLLDAGADKFWMKIIPFLYKYGKYIVIAVRVYQEVQKFAFDATYAQRKGKPELPDSPCGVSTLNAMPITASILPNF